MLKISITPSKGFNKNKTRIKTYRYITIKCEKEDITKIIQDIYQFSEGINGWNFVPNNLAVEITTEKAFKHFEICIIPHLQFCY